MNHARLLAPFVVLFLIIPGYGAMFPSDAAPTITQVGDDVIAKWDLITPENLTFDNVSLIGGVVSLGNTSGRIDLQGPADLLAGIATNLTMSGGAVTILPTSDWWDTNYLFRRPINIHDHDGTALPINFTYNMTLDTASLIASGKARGDLNDLRVVKQSSGSFKELDRMLLQPNNSSSTVLFKGDIPIQPGSWENSTYYLYYGNKNAQPAPQNQSKIFLYYDNFTKDTRGNYVVQNCLLDGAGTAAVVTHDAVRGRLNITALAANPGATLISPIQASNARIELSMRVNGYYKQGQRESNLELVTRYTNLQNYYVEAFPVSAVNPSIYKWVGGVRTGPLTTSAGNNPKLGIEYTAWFSAMNGTLRGGLNSTQLLNVADASLGGLGNLGFGISSGDGYVDNLTVRLDIEKWPTIVPGTEVGTYRSPGMLVTGPIDAGTQVSWGSLNWSSIDPTNTELTISTRSSPDAVNWSAWSPALTVKNGSPITSIDDRYLQVRAVLKAEGSTVSPSLSWVGLNFTRYVATGTVETQDISIKDIISWVALNVTSLIPPAPGRSIVWETSNNSGLSWMSVPTDGNLSLLNASPMMRLRATLQAGNTTGTPFLDGFSVSSVIELPPTLNTPLPKISFPEDGARPNGLNLSRHFQDQSKLTYSWRADGTNISVSIQDNGSVDFAAMVANWSGVTNVVFRATDAKGLWLESSTVVTVVPVNDPPVITSQPPTTALVGQVFSYKVQASDVDGDLLVFELEDMPSGMTMELNSTAQWTPTLAQYGTHHVNISVFDGIIKVFQNFSVQVDRVGGNHAPTINSTPLGSAVAGMAYAYQLVASDTDNDTLSYSLLQGPTGMTIDPNNGLIYWAIGKDQIGNFTVIVDVTDTISHTNQTFTINVTAKPPNRPPVITGLTDQRLKGKEISYDLSTHATDPDDLPGNLTWNIESSSVDMFTSWIEGTTLFLKPVKGASGNGNITLVVKDANGASDRKTISVEVVKIRTNKPLISTMTIAILIAVLVIVIILVVLLVASRSRSGKAEAPEHVPDKARPTRPHTGQKSKATKKPDDLKGPVEVEPTEAGEEEVAEPEVEQDAEEVPVVPKKIDEPAQIDQSRAFMVKILDANFAQGLTKEEREGLEDAISSMEKDPAIKKISLSPEGTFLIEPNTEMTLDSIAISFGNVLDYLTKACFSTDDGKVIKKGRQSVMAVIEKTLGDDKGPAATALRRRLLQGALSSRLMTGVPGLDDLLGGGIPKGESILFQMPAGGVKEVLMDQLLREALNTQQGVLMTLSNMTPARFLSESDKKGIKARAVAEQGELRIIDWHSYKTMRVRDVEEDKYIHRSSKSLTNLAIAITDASKKLEGDLVKRAIFDIITPGITIFGVDPMFKLLQSMVAKLKEQEFTSVFMIEKDMHEPEDIATIGQNFDTVVDIERKKDDRSVSMSIAVLSMSVPGYCTDVRKIEITSEGLVVRDGRK